MSENMMNTNDTTINCSRVHNEQAKGHDLIIQTITTKEGWLVVDQQINRFVIKSTDFFLLN